MNILRSVGTSSLKKILQSRYDHLDLTTRVNDEHSNQSMSADRCRVHVICAQILYNIHDLVQRANLDLAKFAVDRKYEWSIGLIAVLEIHRQNHKPNKAAAVHEQCSKHH